MFARFQEAAGTNSQEIVMSSKTLAAAGAFVALAMLAPLPSHAAVVAPSKPAAAAADSSLLHQVHRPGVRCWAWRKECAARWGWGTWRFRRCLARHGCW
jgi:hypothetical protein